MNVNVTELRSIFNYNVFYYSTGKRNCCNWLIVLIDIKMGSHI